MHIRKFEALYGKSLVTFLENLIWIIDVTLIGRMRISDIEIIVFFIVTTIINKYYDITLLIKY